MSLEQALADNTATMKQLIAVLATAAEAGAMSAPSTADADADAGGAVGHEPPKRTRRTKEQIAADNAAAAAAAAADTSESATPPVDTTATTTTATSEQTSSAASATAPADVPPVTMQTITEKLMSIHKRDGNAGVKPILDKFGVTSVPGLASKNLADVDAAVEAALNPAAGASLFS